MIIPYASLSSEALTSIIDDWLSRQAQEQVLTNEQQSVIALRVKDSLMKGEMLITWDDESQTINLVSSDQFVS